MRKLLNTCALVLAFCLCGCSDDDGPVPGLKVLYTTAKFDASGGEGKIEVQSPAAITAVSEEDWCTVSVSGQTVNVTVPVNETITGRTAMVAITAGDDTLQVPVYQSGDAFICDLRDYGFPMRGGSLTIPLKTVRVRDVSVETPEWLKYDIQDEGIVFTADPADNDRFARVTVSCGINSVTAVLSQWSVEGDYTLSFANDYGMLQTGTAVVKKSETTYYDVETTGTGFNSIIKAVYSEETSRMVIPFGQQSDYSDDYVVVLCAVVDGGYLFANPNVQYVADAKFDEDTGKVRFEFKDNGTLPGFVGLCYAVLSKMDGRYITNFGLVSNLVMTKQ